MQILCFYFVGQICKGKSVKQIILIIICFNTLTMKTIVRVFQNYENQICDSLHIKKVTVLLATLYKLAFQEHRVSLLIIIK